MNRGIPTHSLSPSPVPLQPSLAVISAVHFSNISQASTVPALQLKYHEKLVHHIKEKNIPLPQGRDDQICRSCNCLLIPGFNAQVRIVYIKRKLAKQGLRLKVLRYRCLSCNFNNDHDGILHQRKPLKLQEKPSEAEVKVRSPLTTPPVLPSLAKDPSKSDFKAEWNPKSDSKSGPDQQLSQNKAKKRSQKRKQMSNLQSLLNNKKKTELKKPSLDLMDFMKN